MKVYNRFDLNALKPSIEGPPGRPRDRVAGGPADDADQR